MKGIYCFRRLHTVLESTNLMISQYVLFCVFVSVSFYMFPCSKGHLITAYLIYYLMTLPTLDKRINFYRGLFIDYLLTLSSLPLSLLGSLYRLDLIRSDALENWLCFQFILLNSQLFELKQSQFSSISKDHFSGYSSVNGKGRLS